MQREPLIEGIRQRLSYNRSLAFNPGAVARLENIVAKDLMSVQELYGDEVVTAVWIKIARWLAVREFGLPNKTEAAIWRPKFNAVLKGVKKERHI